MALRTDWSTRSCPIARSVNVLGDPWVLLILREAFIGTRRFEDFRSRLGAADNVLSRRLTTMVEAGLLRRVPYRAGRRTHQEYQLTQAGADLLPVLQAMLLWGQKHTVTPDGGGALQIIHLDCGALSDRAEVCSACGGVLEPGRVAWNRTWDDEAPTVLAGATG